MKKIIVDVILLLLRTRRLVKIGAGKLDHCLECFSYNFKNGICLDCGWKSEQSKTQTKLKEMPLKFTSESKKLS